MKQTSSSAKLPATSAQTSNPSPRSGGRLYGQTPSDLPLSDATVLSGDPGTDSSAQPAPGHRPTYEEISTRAYHIWQKNGSVHDQHLDHWFEAERQLESER